jgi:hypothetical protein
MVDKGLKQVGFAKYAGFREQRDQIMINIIREDNTYKAFINGERFPLSAAIIVIDQIGTVSDVDTFIELAECCKVQLTQYQKQNSPTGDTYFLA